MDETRATTGGSVADLMDALASNDVDRLRSASSLVVPNSSAAIYLEHQANLAEADADGGDVLDPQEVSGSGGAFEMCLAGHRRCAAFTEFVQDRSGRVARFRVNGLDIAPRLRRGDGQSVRAVGAIFTFLTSYRPARKSRSAYFVVRVESGDKPLLVNVTSVRYRDPTGRQGLITDWGGPRTLGAHSSALIYSGFRGVGLGGTMTLDGCIDGCNRRYLIRIET